MIKINNLDVILKGKEILKNINLTIDDKKIYVILGPSGCGKSVLLKNIIGLLTPTGGEILIDNINIVDADKKEIDNIRKKCGFLFQHSALFDSLTIEENLEFPLLQHKNYSKDEIKDRVNEKLKMVGLHDVNNKKPSELSGGMQTRAALARSIILEPEYIFYDEPTTGLDPIMSRIIDDLIVELNYKLGVTSIVVTHDMKTASKISDNMALLYNGKKIIEGKKSDLMRADNPYLNQFVEGLREGPMVL